MSEAKRILKKVHFEFDTAHLAYTDKSQGGAASGINDPYLLKSNEIEKSLTKNQKALLQEMGIEVSGDIDKSVSSEKNSGLSSPDGASQGEQPENKTNEGNEMSQEILKQLEDRLAATERELKVEKAVNMVSKYELSEEIRSGLAGAIASLGADEKSAVIKALDAIVSAKQEAVNKTLELEKAVKEGDKENPILKALSQEQGHSEKTPTSTEKSRIDIIKEETEKLFNKKGAK